MLKYAFLGGILMLSGCASKPYVCTDGPVTYYADHPTALVITEDLVVVGDCELREQWTSNQETNTHQDR
jgi:hypothetical protein